MKNIHIALAFILLPNLTLSQVTITLDSCLAAAYSNMQFGQQELLIDEGRKSAMEGNKVYNLPTLELSGNATYQNEQISIPVAIPGFVAPEAPLNFNRLLVNFNQTIYNGNLAAKRKLIDSLQYNEQMQKVEMDWLKIKSQVIGVYTTLLMVKTNEEILAGQTKVLQKKYDQLKGALASGVTTKSKLQILEAEQLKLQQHNIELQFSELAFIKTLSNYTGFDITTNTILKTPTPLPAFEQQLNRPELRLIDTKMNGITAKEDLAGNARLPYIGLFGSVGLGYPGYNIFEQEVRPMAIAGIAVKWNIWDWNKTKNDKAQLIIGQSVLTQEKNRLEMSFERELIKQKSEIEKYENLLKTDDAIIKAQSKVSKSFSAELLNGTATASEYTTQLNTESTAKLNKELHQIQLILAILTYNTIKGN